MYVEVAKSADPAFPACVWVWVAGVDLVTLVLCSLLWVPQARAVLHNANSAAPAGNCGAGPASRGPARALLSLD